MILDSTGRPYQVVKATTDNPIGQVEYMALGQIFGKPTSVRYEDLVKRYQGWVHHCAWINAQALSEVQYKLFVAGKSDKVPTRQPPAKTKAFNERLSHAARKAAPHKGDFSEVLEHPAFEVWDNPNPYMSGREFRQLFELYRGLTGNAYIWKERGPLNVTVRLWIIPSQWMRIIPSKEDIIEGYLYKRGLNEVTFEPDEIIHLRRPNPSDPYFYGYGEVESEADMAIFGQTIDDYERYTLANNARPDFMILSEHPLDREQREDLRRDFWRMHGTQTNAQRFAILAGGLDIKPLGWSPKDVSHLKGEEKVMHRIGMAFGIPKSMLTTDDVNLANAEIGERQHAKYVIKPRMAYDTEIFTDHWLVEYDPKLFWGFDDPVPQNEKEDAEIEEIRVRSRTRTINELRAQDNLEPVAWGDEDPKPPQEAPSGFFAYEQLQLKGGNGNGQKQLTCEHGHKQVSEVPEDTPEIRAFAAIMRDEFASQRRDVLGNGKAIKAIAPDGAGQLTDIERAAMEEALMATAPGWADATAAATGLTLAGLIEDGMMRGGGYLAEHGVEISFDVTRPEVTRAVFAEDYTRRWANAVTATTRDRIHAHLAAAYKNGESIPQLRDRLMRMFDGFEKSRATMIARTEMSRAVGVGQKEAWRASGQVTETRWICGYDCCDWCAELEGKTISIQGGTYADMGTEIIDRNGNTFLVNYETFEGAGGINGPPLHPNCRCDEVPVLVER